ncbi:MAG: gluconokinase [Verrucomicrobiota bacterium]
MRAPELLVLALDIGSSSTRAALFNERGRLIPGTEARREYSLRYTPDGGAELSPFRLRRAVQTCLGESLRRSPARAPIVAVGASAFWHGLLGLDANGQPLTPVFTWADSRAAADAAQLRREFDERKIHARTGCMLRASFWPAKLRWLRRTNRQLFRGVHRWVSPVDWIFAELFGAADTSVSMASATGLYDQRCRDWHGKLCEACGIAPGKLGGLSESATGAAAGFSKLRHAEIFAAIGDGAAGNIGCDATEAGRFAINVGTSAAVRTLDSRRRPFPFGLFRYAVDDRRTVVGGAVSNAGNLHRWCLRELRLSERESTSLQRPLAATNSLIVLPFWVGERAPTWPENLPGAILGLSQSTDAAAIHRATTCATFYRLAEILEMLEEKRGRAKQIIVSGGIVHSKPSLPVLADALGRDIAVSAQPEASLRGAAIYALEKLGYDSAPLPKPKTIRHDRALADKHRVRRERQIALEKRLASGDAAQWRLTNSAESI